MCLASLVRGKSSRENFRRLPPCTILDTPTKPGLESHVASLRRSLASREGSAKNSSQAILIRDRSLVTGITPLCKHIACHIFHNLNDTHKSCLYNSIHNIDLFCSKAAVEEMNKYLDFASYFLKWHSRICQMRKPRLVFSIGKTHLALNLEILPFDVIIRSILPDL
jgi:hypothetical protein